MTFTANDRIVGPVTPAVSVTLIGIDFYFEAADEIAVFKSGSNTALILDTDYTVSLPTTEGGTDGSITLTTPANGTDTYTIRGTQPLERTSDLQFRGDLRSGPINLELDRLWAAVTDGATSIARTLRFSETSDVPTPLDAGVAGARADKLIQFSPDGTGMVVSTASGADVSTVAAIEAEITALSLITSEITALEAVDAEIVTVAGVAGNVTTVAGIAADVTTVAGDSANIATVAGISADITTVAADAADIGAVAAISADIATVAANDANITTVAGISADITAVAADSVDIGVVAGLSTEIAALGPIAADITTVAGIAGNVTTVAGISADVSSVSVISGDVATVAGDSADIQTLAAISADITALASGTGGTLTGNWTATGVWDFTSTEAIRIPAGNTAQRPGTPVAGDFRRQSTYFEVYDGSVWMALPEFRQSQVASAARGDILYRDGALVWTQLASSGVVGEILTVTDVNGQIGWQAPTSGAAVLLETIDLTAFGATSFDIDLPSGYKRIEIRFDNVEHDSIGSESFRGRLSDDGGTTFETGASYYQGRVVDESANSIFSSSGDSSFYLLNLGASTPTKGKIFIEDYESTTLQTVMEHRLDEAVLNYVVGRQYATSVGAHDAFRVLINSGVDNFDAGQVRVYGHPS